VFAVDPSENAGLIWTILALLLVPALVALNGLFVAAEFALVSVRKTRIEELIGRGVKRATLVLQVISQLDHAIAATQLGITLASPSFSRSAATRTRESFRISPRRKFRALRGRRYRLNDLVRENLLTSGSADQDR